MMRVVVACRTTELGCDRAGLQRGELAFQTVDKHHYLLAQTGRRSRLAMCLGQHRYVGPLFGIGAELGYQFLYLRVVHLCQRLFDREGNGGVVDVLRSQSEMDEFLVCIQSAQTVELLFQKVFYGLYVVVGHALYLFDASGIRL